MNQCSNTYHCGPEVTNLVPRALFPGIRSGAGKGPGISRSHDHQTPRIRGCTKLAYDLIRYKKHRRWWVEQRFYQCFAGSDFPWVTEAFHSKMFWIYPERPGCCWSLTDWIWEVDAISRLYCSHHNKERKLLLKKQLSTKPTWQLMRFAWRTKTMVLPDEKVDKVAITKQSKHC